MAADDGGALAAAVIAQRARQLDELHRLAAERLGLGTVLATLRAWESVDPLRMTAAWFENVAPVAVALSRISYRLAAKYYTLVRADGTGYALPDVDGVRTGSVVTKGELWTEFAVLLNEVLAATNPTDTPTVSTTTEVRQDIGDRLDAVSDEILDAFEDIVPRDEFNESIPVDTDWEWSDDIPEIDDVVEEVWEDISDEVIEELERKARRERDSAERTAKEALDRIETARKNAASLAAGKVEQTVLSAGRRLISSAGTRDTRRKAWMRVTGPNPCGFCAMLATRGAVYRSEESAFGRRPEGYHDNCHCQVVPVFVDEPYYSARDKFFIDAWETVTRDSANDAKRRKLKNGSLSDGAKYLARWRKWLRQQYRLGTIPDAGVFGPARPA